MNPERYVNKKHEEANAINRRVHKFFADHPRSRKSEATVADEIIKEEAVRYLPFSQVPEVLQPWYDNMGKAGVRILEDGFLEIRRWDGGPVVGGKRMPLRQTVDGLPSAIRMQEHILNGYHSDNTERTDEYSKLESIQEVIEYAHELLNNWNSADETDRKILQMQLADVVLQLEKCRNEFKVETKDQAQAVMALRDSRGRENPGALAARTVAALNRLGERFEELHVIAPQIALRKEILELEERRIEGVLRKANSQLTVIGRHAVFAPQTVAGSPVLIRDYEVEVLKRKCNQVLYELSTIHISPYLQQARQAAFFIERDVKKHFVTVESVTANRGVITTTLTDVQKILTATVPGFG
jgi:hypothetical protein